MMHVNEHWVAAYETGVDYEAELVADRLKDAGVPAVVLNQREKSIGIPFSDQKLIRVMVQPERLDDAKEILSQQPVSDEELEQAALDADPDVAEHFDGEDEGEGGEG